MWWSQLYSSSTSPLWCYSRYWAGCPIRGLKYTNIQAAPTAPSLWRTQRFCLCNTHGLKGEWKRQYRPTSGPWNLHLTEMKDDITCPKSGITSLNRGWWRKVLGPPMEGVGAVWGILLAFPFASNTIWRLRHTEEGCSCSWKLKKVLWKKILCYLVIGYWNYLHIW